MPSPVKREAIRLARFEDCAPSWQATRLTTKVNGEHHLTIPAHLSIRVGTLSAILGDVAEHLERDKADVARELFG